MKRFYLVLSFFITLAILPLIWWQLQPSPDLSVAVIDKTVPSESFREHQGIHWALNHLKIPNQKGDPFHLASDYYGTLPNETEQTYTEKELPADYSDYDIVYLADTYGVFLDDVPWESDGTQGDRSEKLYGGLSNDEWLAMRRRFDDQTPSVLVAEYNSFASPTEKDVRDSMTHYLGIEWDGWTGRYFTELDLSLNQEIPHWLVKEHSDTWDYSGPGMILVNDFTEEVLVLENDEHLNGKGISLDYTEAGQELFGLDQSTEYTYWFDIITAKDNTEVLATYDWNLTEAGEELLASHDIPLSSAAVTRQQRRQHTSFYFAGDYNDTTNLPLFYQIKGLTTFNRWLVNVTKGNFYWSAFMPMMETIFEQAEIDLGVALEESRLNDGNEEEEDPVYSFRVTGPQFEVLQEGEWQPIIIKGVNMGMANPGHFPGEAAISEAEYARWFEMIGEMNANTIRIYTIHPPGFYRALRDYNETHDQPIYLFHGVWMNEEGSIDSQNTFEKGNLADFQEEIRKVVDLSHGNLVIEKEPGHAYGTYDVDISDYVIGWMIGTEWDPHVVVGTNAENSDIGEYQGTYFETQGASPFEHFLAEQMDLMMVYEMEHYGKQRPMSFTNWVTTDLLDHPTESEEDEDLVSVNPNVIHTLGAAKETGQFASYHVYPYYPDFLNYTKKYNEFIDHRGNPNNYAAYLKDLHEAHDMPVLIAEFGIPASRGRTHENPFGRHQGGVTEEEQGIIVKEMFEEIMEEGMLGGLVFTWQDEWFKRTWNTMDYDNPDERPFWSNAQTNEQQFGILSFDRHKIRVNGDVSDWADHSDPLFDNDNNAEPVQAVYVDHDERYLYVRIDFDPAAAGYPVLTLDTVPNQGNDSIAGLNGAQLSEEADFIVDLSDEARVLVDEYYDLYTIQYGLKLEMLGPDIKTPIKNSGNFVPIRFALNKEYYVVEEARTLPFIAYETGKLKRGNGDPDAADYDSMADYFVNDDTGVIELRLPWLLISARNPSQKEFQGDLMAEGLEASVNIEDITIGALWVETNEDESIDQVVYQAPSQAYTWDNWGMPLVEERLKQSYWILQEAFEGY